MGRKRPRKAVPEPASGEESKCGDCGEDKDSHQAGQRRAAGWGRRAESFSGLEVGAGAGEEREGRRFLNESKILRAQKREGREGPRGVKGWREREEEEVGGGRRVRDSD